MRVDVPRPDMRFDEIRLEKNPLPLYPPPFPPEFPKPFQKDRCDISLVIGHLRDKRVCTPIPFRTTPHQKRGAGCRDSRSQGTQKELASATVDLHSGFLPPGHSADLPFLHHARKPASRKKRNQKQGQQRRIIRPILPLEFGTFQQPKAGFPRPYLPCPKAQQTPTEGKRRPQARKPGFQISQAP